MTEFRQMARDLGLESEPKIFARFFDHAIEDQEASKASGRKRFKPAIYIELRNLAESVQDVFHRKMEEEDKRTYPEQWAMYKEAHDKISNRSPSLKAIPGMTVAAYEEFKALELWDCEKVANYTGELDNLESYQSIARKIMEISDECLREKRPVVRTETDGSIHDSSGQDRPARTTNIHYIEKEETGEEKSEEESFSYRFKVSM